jgi:sugar-specific transcriptional regulator TrmB
MRKGTVVMMNQKEIYLAKQVNELQDKLKEYKDYFGDIEKVKKENQERYEYMVSFNKEVKKRAKELFEGDGYHLLGRKDGKSSWEDK